MLYLRSLLYAVVIPGTVAVLMPVLIGGGLAMPAPWEWSHLVAVTALAAGAAILAACVVDFARRGRGTLAPFDPPTRLVVRGLYRFVRNPMYLGAVTANLGWALWFRSGTLVAYALGVWVLHHGFVRLYEEPALRARFGDDYARYVAAVGRWIPGRSWRSGAEGGRG